MSFTIENNVLKGARVPMDSSNFDIGSSILKIFDEAPKHVAQIYVKTGEKTLFEEMKDSSIRCALWLQKQNIGSGDIIVVCTRNRPSAYIPCIATFYVGAIFNPWHYEVTSNTARYLMKLTRPKVVFACEDSIAVLREAARLEKVDARFVVFGKYPAIQSLQDIMMLHSNGEVRTFGSRSSIQPNSVALILFSSGTTGLPKGVVFSYKSFASKIFSGSYTGHKVALCYSSLYWVSGTVFMLECITTKATRILHEDFEPEETCRVIEKYQVNWIFIAPTAMKIWYKTQILQKYRLKSLKAMLTGGSKLNPKVIESLRKSLPHVTIDQSFGITENAGSVAMQTSDCKKIDSVGFVLPNVELKVIDTEIGKVLGPNEEGELCIKSPSLMLGYHKNPTATRAAIDDQGWLHTGDKGYYTKDGEVVVIDRLKEIMKCKGYQISPHEIEDTLLKHSAVMEVAVIPIPHEIDGERPLAFVRKAPGAEVTEAELVQLSQKELGNPKKLSGGVRFVNEIPYTPSGKISRNELKEMAKLVCGN